LRDQIRSWKSRHPATSSWVHLGSKQVRCHAHATYQLAEMTFVTLKVPMNIHDELSNLGHTSGSRHDRLVRPPLTRYVTHVTMDEIRVVVNGEAQSLPARATVAALLRRLQLDPLRVAVERNLKLVPRRNYDLCEIAAGDALEIVTLV